MKTCDEIAESNLNMFNNSYVDLHVHSYYSDGTMSPDEIVKAACENGVGLLAVTDHNVVEGSRQLRDLCAQNGISYIPGVELDSMENETNFHILAYGFDMDNQEFIQFIKHLRFLLDESGVRLVEAMQNDFPDITLPDYMAFDYDVHLGGWKALHYLMAKGLTTQLREGIQYYPKYNITYDKSGYPSISSICYRIKQAGGYAILAHPGVLIDTTNIEHFSNELKRIITFGLDGVECYYPSNTEIVTQACINICTEQSLLITAGSDCHGAFGKTKVGEMSVSFDKVVLGDLV